MTRRRFADGPPDLVARALAGFTRAHPELVLHTEPTFVTRRELTPMTVGLVGGGASGHEPLHTGFVGDGMLSAAVPGAVSASPTAAQVAAATAHVDTGAGVVQIVGNHTGDVVAFRIAAEIAADAGREVHRVLVDDDLADRPDHDDGPGRRSTATVVVVEKVCGAAAETGRDAAEVAALGRRVVETSRSLAVAPAHDLTAASALAVVRAVGLHRGDAVIAVVNGLGATPDLELHLLFAELAGFLDGLGIGVVRALVGSYVTSPDTAGVSLTLTRADDALVRLWDAPVRTPALTW